jgi:hypothetical protein
MNSMTKDLGAASVALAAALAASFAWAGPADYVTMPAVTYGEREVDFKAGTIKQSQEHRVSAASLGFGYGVTQNWFTELYVKYKREGSTSFDAFEWENKFQLTETGQYPVDVGFLLEMERPQDRSEGYEVRFGPLFQTEFGKTQLNGNLLFQRNYRAAASNTMQIMYQWQAKYRYKPRFEFGVQAFGELGDWNHLAARTAQSHLIGPAVFGKLSVGPRQAILYNAALLVDAGDTKHSKTVRTQIEYEF